MNPNQAPQQPQQPPQVTAQQATGRPAAAPPKTNPNSTQNTLQIAEIRDGIVIMQDGSFRAVVACQSVNFDLMSGPEREAVEYYNEHYLEEKGRRNGFYYGNEVWYYKFMC